MNDDNWTHSTDAAVWAREFCKTKVRAGWWLHDIDEDLMIGWFANAMCAASDAEGKERDVLHSQLMNLLAVIHRDGGHHTGDHGTEQSIKDAIDKVCAERVALSFSRHLLRRFLQVSDVKVGTMLERAKKVQKLRSEALSFLSACDKKGNSKKVEENY